MGPVFMQLVTVFLFNVSPFQYVTGTLQYPCFPNLLVIHVYVQECWLLPGFWQKLRTFLCTCMFLSSRVNMIAGQCGKTNFAGCSQGIC